MYAVLRLLVHVLTDADGPNSRDQCDVTHKVAARKSQKKDTITQAISIHESLRLSIPIHTNFNRCNKL